jgi:hypothetical protein
MRADRIRARAFGAFKLSSVGSIPFRQYTSGSAASLCYLLMAARVKASRVFMSRLICKRPISYVRRRSYARARAEYQADSKDVRRREASINILQP